MTLEMAKLLQNYDRAMGSRCHVLFYLKLAARFIVRQNMNGKCNTRTTVAFVAFTTKNKQCETNGGGLSHWYNLSDL